MRLTVTLELMCDPFASKHRASAILAELARHLRQPTADDSGLIRDAGRVVGRYQIETGQGRLFDDQVDA